MRFFRLDSFSKRVDGRIGLRFFFSWIQELSEISMGIKTPLERYQEKPFTGSSHVWAIDRLSQLPRDTTLLDIGAGSGIMGRKGEEFGFPEG